MNIVITSNLISTKTFLPKFLNTNPSNKLIKEIECPKKFPRIFSDFLTGCKNKGTLKI